MSKSDTAETSPQTADGDDLSEHPWLAARRGQRRWVPWIASLLCLLIGLSDVLAIFSPGFHARFHRITPYVPGTLTNVARSADVIVGLALLLLSHGLRRRKRRAWQAVIALLILDLAIHAVHFRTMHLPTTVVAVILLGTLLYFHADFYAVGDRRTRWLALWVFLGLAVADLVIGLTYLSVSPLASSYSFPTRLLDVVAEVSGVTGHILFLSDARADTYHAMTTALGVFTLVVPASLFLRPAEPKAQLAPSDADRIRQLLDRYGDRDSLGYFALRDDKSVIWSPTGKACICYRVVSGVMLAGGDPLGDPEAGPGAIQAFLEEAAGHAWAPAVMGCSELGAEVWSRERDLTALELGDEAVVNVADFSLSRGSMRNVRQRGHRGTRSVHWGG